MEQTKVKNFICAGQFRGSEVEDGVFWGPDIEPGTFHKSCSDKALKSATDKQDSEGKRNEGDSDNEVDTDAESSSDTNGRQD